MSTENYQQVTVRRLPDGDPQVAQLHGLDRTLLELGIESGSAFGSVHPGDLVEVNCPQTLYLGEVRALRDNTLVVGIEHALDRASLASIQQVWHVPADD